MSKIEIIEKEDVPLYNYDFWGYLCLDIKEKDRISLNSKIIEIDDEQEQKLWELNFLTYSGIHRDSGCTSKIFFDKSRLPLFESIINR